MNIVTGRFMFSSFLKFLLLNHNFDNLSIYQYTGVTKRDEKKEIYLYLRDY
jgi:hypothetical protein